MFNLNPFGEFLIFADHNNVRIRRVLSTERFSGKRRGLSQFLRQKIPSLTALAGFHIGSTEIN
jgi:hypothetical protein